MSSIESERLFTLPDPERDDRFGMLIGGAIVPEVFAREAERAGDNERLIRVAVTAGEITLFNG